VLGLAACCPSFKLRAHRTIVRTRRDGSDAGDGRSQESVRGSLVEKEKEKEKGGRDERQARLIEVRESRHVETPMTSAVLDWQD
jgi:hypothetical protein